MHEWLVLGFLGGGYFGSVWIRPLEHQKFWCCFLFNTKKCLWHWNDNWSFSSAFISRFCLKYIWRETHILVSLFLIIMKSFSKVIHSNILMVLIWFHRILLEKSLLLKKLRTLLLKNKLDVNLYRLFVKDLMVVLRKVYDKFRCLNIFFWHIFFLHATSYFLVKIIVFLFHATAIIWF